MVSRLSLGVIYLCLAGAFVLSFLGISRSAQRRIYWTMAGTAGAGGIFLKYPTWDDAALTGLVPVVAMTIMAFVATPYIKVGGKIYSLTITDPDPEVAPTTDSDSPQDDTDLHPDSYSGILTAKATWWCLVITAVIAAGNVYAAVFGKGELWVGLMTGTFFALTSVVMAYGDASWGYPIARGQYLQFVVNTVITAGVFYFLYVAAYYAGQRHPLRRQQSMEYRAHPRHRRIDS